MMENRQAQDSGLVIYQAGEEACSPGHGFGPAVRDHYLIHCVLTGQGTLYRGERRWKIGKSEGFLILPEEVNYYQADEEEPWHYCWVGFHGREVPGILKKCGISRDNPVFEFHDTVRIQNCIGWIQEHYTRRNEEFLALSRLYEFFAMLKGEEEGAGLTVRLAQRVREYLEKNYSYGITVQDVANALSVDRSHMFRCFKEEYGISVQEYLLDYRLERAARLIGRSDMNITEIMYSCGFRDLPNFSRQFRKKYGQSPGQMRRRREHA